jgi:hypothetical protein
VALPTLSAGIEENDNAARHNIAAAQIGGSGKIAMIARPAEIVEIVVAAVFLWQEVFDVKPVKRQVVFM